MVIKVVAPLDRDKGQKKPQKHSESKVYGWTFMDIFL